jgi:hypothetical protein
MKKNDCLKLHLSPKRKQTYIHNTKCDQKVLGLQLLEEYEVWNSYTGYRKISTFVNNGGWGVGNKTVTNIGINFT